MELQGHIKHIGKSEFVGNNGFEKREMVITTEEQYPQHILIQFTQGRCSLLDNLHIGELVKVYFNLQGREWTNPQGEIRYFNSLNGWKIEKIQITEVAKTPNYTPQEVSKLPSQEAQQEFKQGQFFDSYGQVPFPMVENPQNQKEYLDDLPF